jgi:SAM-dependent methyltransferase
VPAAADAGPIIACGRLRRPREVALRTLAWSLLALLLVAPAAARSQQAPVRIPDAPFVPTPDIVVAGMLKMAAVTAKDVVYDLGSGDGKIVIAAARVGARGVGIDIDPRRVTEATANANAAGVSDRTTFILGDIFDPAITISDATVVMLYLWERLNIKLMPRLKAELRPGTRIVSNSFTMGPTWPAEQSQLVGMHYIYKWTIK